MANGGAGCGNADRVARGGQLERAAGVGSTGMQQGRAAGAGSGGGQRGRAVEAGRLRGRGRGLRLRERGECPGVAGQLGDGAIGVEVKEAI